MNENVANNLSYRLNYYNDSNLNDLENNFGEFHLNNSNESEYDVNGNNCTIKEALTERNDASNRIRMNKRGYCAPTDVVNEHFNFLPTFIKSDLCNGPISRCENFRCKKPIFDYVYYEFCFG